MIFGLRNSVGILSLVDVGFLLVEFNLRLADLLDLLWLHVLQCPCLEDQPPPLHSGRGQDTGGQRLP